ncbi:unnamed protein product [Gongylonema pulchrum]|uniref:EGF-like domain-containing protein n=1 Tax=Gongylonema pulchrum TaxID=637853 RepID=A0A183E603_9BILA|nr:unnamed protein product [Gongylonema pulchrum]
MSWFLTAAAAVAATAIGHWGTTAGGRWSLSFGCRRFFFFAESIPGQSRVMMGSICQQQQQQQEQQHQQFVSGWRWMGMTVVEQQQQQQREKQQQQRQQHEKSLFGSYKSQNKQYAAANDRCHCCYYNATMALVVNADLPASQDITEIPECEDSINDCAYGGKCASGPDGSKTCLCPASCPASIPVSCRAGKRDDYCMSMSDDYRDKYLLPEPACHMGICVCPPMFDPWKLEGAIELLPFKCDRRMCFLHIFKIYM